MAEKNNILDPNWLVRKYITGSLMMEEKNGTQGRSSEQCIEVKYQRW